MKLLTALVLAGTLLAAQPASGPGAASKDQEAVRKAERLESHRRALFELVQVAEVHERELLAEERGLETAFYMFQYPIR